MLNSLPTKSSKSSDNIAAHIVGLKCCAYCRNTKKYRLHFLHNRKTCPYGDINANGPDFIGFEEWMSPERLLASNIVGHLLADLELLVEVESSPTLVNGIHDYVFSSLFHRIIFSVFIVPFSFSSTVVVDEHGNLETVPMTNYLTCNESSVDHDGDMEGDVAIYDHGNAEDEANILLSLTKPSSSSSTSSMDMMMLPPSIAVHHSSTSQLGQQYVPHSSVASSIQPPKRQKLNRTVESQLDDISSTSVSILSSTSSATTGVTNPSNPRRKRILIERNAFIQAMKNSYKDIVGVYFSRKNGYRRILDEYPYKKAATAKRNVPYFELRCVLVFLIDMLHLSQTEADWEIILKHAYRMEAMDGSGSSASTTASGSTSTDTDADAVAGGGSDGCDKANVL